MFPCVGMFGSAKASDGACGLMVLWQLLWQFDHNCSTFLRVSVACLMLLESVNIQPELCFCKASDQLCFFPPGLHDAADHAAG